MDFYEVVYNRPMEYIDELYEALIEITNNPELTFNEWTQAIHEKVRELVDKNKLEHESTSQVISHDSTSS